jgi:aminobenzoyl-glutamate utilization protein B
MGVSRRIWDLVDAKAAVARDLSDAVWAVPEVNFEEVRSSRLHADLLAAEGFLPRLGVGGMPTALCAETPGEGGPLIAILGEYDALPGLSQRSGVTRPEPVVPGGHGHGCGHNLLGAASALAAVALRDWLRETGLPGRIRYYGCPAEEGGSSKGFMVRDGLFDDVDAAICWHPAAFTGVNPPESLACAEIEFTFQGRAAHAAATPELGRSALDAVELMHVGVNYLREHMSDRARVHYAITDSGGAAPNVVQARAVTRHLVRAPTLDEMWQLVARVEKVAEGAALMTDTQVTARQVSGDANLIGNAALEAALDAVLRELGGPRFDAQDQAAAAAFQRTFSPEDIRASCTRFGVQPQPGMALHDGVFPLGARGPQSVGSTDVGSVSWVVPTVQVRVACYAIGTPGHSWQLVAQGALPAAHKGLIHAAKAMAALAADLIGNPDLLAQAARQHRAFRAAHPFRNPVEHVELSLPDASARPHRSPT